MFTLATSNQHYIGGASQHNQKEIKGIQIEKKEVKLSPFSDGMNLYIGIPKVSTKKN